MLLISAFADKTFDIIICHNVLEYVDDKAEVIKVLTRLLKQDGILSIVKHRRAFCQVFYRKRVSAGGLAGVRRGKKRAPPADFARKGRKNFGTPAENS